MAVGVVFPAFTQGDPSIGWQWDPPPGISGNVLANAVAVKSGAPGAQGALAHLAGLPAIRFTAKFLAFDTDCQTGQVSGTLDAQDGAGVVALGAAPRTTLRRVPLSEQ